MECQSTSHFSYLSVHSLQVSVPLAIGILIYYSAAIALRLKEFVGLIEVVAIARLFAKREGDDADMILCAVVHCLNTAQILIHQLWSICWCATKRAVIGH